MADLNSVSITARVTMEPELRQTHSGTPLVNLRVCVNDAIKKDDGTWDQKPNYINVTKFGPDAEVIARSVTVGSPLAIEGRLAWREWTTDAGSKGQALDVVANSVHFLDTKEQAEQRRAARPGHTSQSPVESDDRDLVPF